MRSLIVEDELTGRMRLKHFLEEYGPCDTVVDGNEAIEAFRLSYSTGKVYDLICLDIRMPNTDGYKVLETIRKFEEDADVKIHDRVKVFMTTALDNIKDVSKSFYQLCDEYLTKPVQKDNLDSLLQKYDLI